MRNGPRDRAVMVRLTEAELARLDEFRPSGMSRPAFIRSLLRTQPSPRRSDDQPDVASREEALSILTNLARDGGTSAAIALARELRTDATPSGDALDDLLGSR